MTEVRLDDSVSNQNSATIEIDVAIGEVTRRLVLNFDVGDFLAGRFPIGTSLVWENPGSDDWISEEYNKACKRMESVPKNARLVITRRPV
jgi:hypothetical protein